MGLLHASLPAAVVMLGWALLSLFVLLSALSVRRAFLPRAGLQNLWFAALLIAAIAWSLHIKAGGEVSLGLIGSALFALLFGPARAILGLTAALALHTLAWDGSWINFGVNGVLLAVAPVLAADALQRHVVRRLPRNLFVFIIGNGLFVTLLVTAATSVSLIAAAAAVSHVAVAVDPETVGFALLLAWGEALLSGMIFSAMVVFVPHLVLTYRQDLYLPPRARL